MKKYVVAINIPLPAGYEICRIQLETIEAKNKKQAAMKILSKTLSEIDWNFKEDFAEEFGLLTDKTLPKETCLRNRAEYWEKNIKLRNGEVIGYDYIYYYKDKKKIRKESDYFIKIMEIT